MVQNVFWCLHDALCINIIGVIYTTLTFNFDHFWHGQVLENPLTPLKRAPKIRKITKFESDSLRANEDTAPQSREILQTFVWRLARVNFDKRHGPKRSDSAQNEIATRDNLPRPNCDSDSKADNKRQAFIYTDTGGGLLYGGRHKLVPHHTNFCKFSQLCGTLSSLAKDVSLSKLAILLILRRSFQWCRWIFPNWSRSI